MNLELVNKIKKRKNQGKSISSIKEDLVSEGYTEEEIKSALKIRPAGAVEAIFYGIRKFKERPLFLLSVTAVYLVVPFVIPGVFFLFLGFLGSNLLAILFGAVLFVFLKVVLLIGLINVCLKIYQGVEPSFGHLLEKSFLFWRMVFATALNYLIIGLAFIVPVALPLFLSQITLIGFFLVLAGFILAIFLLLRLYFYDIFLVDLSSGPITSLKKSYLATKGSSVFLLFLILLLFSFAVNALALPFYFLLVFLDVSHLASLLTYLVSLISTPIIFLSTVYFYQGISGNLEKRERIKNKWLFLFLLTVAAFLGLAFLSAASMSSEDDLTNIPIPWSEQQADTLQIIVDTQIRWDLREMRTDLEIHLIENDFSYENYKSSDKWKALSEKIPECSTERLKEEFEVDFEEEYQLKVEDQSFIAWTPLCSEDTIYCVDSNGNALEIEKENIENALENLKCIN